MFENLTEARKELEPKLFRSLHREAIHAVQELKSKEVALIKALQNVDEGFVYRYLGYNSLFRYCTDALKLTDYQSVMYISVARKSKNLPGLQKALDEGEVTVSKVSRVMPVINNENQEYWLELVQNSSKREIEKAVAKVNPKAAHPEKARYLTDTLVELQIPVSEEVFALIKRAQEILTQKSGRGVSLEEVLKVVTQKYLEKEDPLARDKRRQEKLQKKEADIESANAAVIHSPGASKSKIKQSLRDKVLSRDKGRCSYRDGSKRCNQRVFIEVHHILPKENGGADKLENLRTLCSAHHRLIHGHFH